MFGRPAIRVDKDLYESVSRLAETAGYASVDEFVEHMLRRELEKTGPTGDTEKLKERLKGLGYL
jgi:hypothetical protein